jgi:hypothetical protein
MTKEDPTPAVRRVQRLKDSFLTLTAAPLPRKGYLILKLLGAGNPACHVAEAVGCSRSNVSYWKDKFLDMGALRLHTRDVIKLYQLTPLGSRLLTTSESGPVEVVCLEDQAVKFGVVEWERVPVEWRRLGRPRNWEKLGVRIGSVRVVRTSRSIIIHPGRLRGFDVDELLVLSGRIVERVRMVLEHRFGMVLAEEGVPLHAPVTRFYSAEARELVRKLGTTIVEDVGAIDASPPERVPHEEYRGRDLGKARLLMPLQVRRLGERMAGLEAKLDRLSSDVHELVLALKGAVDGGYPPITPSESGVPDHVLRRDPVGMV